MQYDFGLVGGLISVRTGREGPTYDPYSYEEIVVVTQRGKARFHMGLAMWVELENRKGEKYRYDQKNTDEGVIVEAFESIVGTSYKALHKAIERTSRICNKCGGCHETSVDSFPGETLNICENGHVMGSSFDINAVI